MSEIKATFECEKCKSEITTEECNHCKIEKELNQKK